MAIFGLFKKKEENPENIDYISVADDLKQKGDFIGALGQYEKLISVFYKDKPESAYRHIIKEIVSCYIKLGDADKVFEMWSRQYNPSDYGAREMYDLIKILEPIPRVDLVMKVYDIAGKRLLPNKIEFLIRQKKIPLANSLMNELLASKESNESGKSLENLWMTKAKLSMSLLKWEEANRYLDKILERNQNNAEARKLKDFCLKQVKMNE